MKNKKEQTELEKAVEQAEHLTKHGVPERIGKWMPLTVYNCPICGRINCNTRRH